jgi:uncharacterized repeat protein (TIGR04076 family)
MFKVKATVVAFLGNQKLYPCHMGHKIGDEVVFDGERYVGRLCPDVWPLIAPKVSALHQAGPRYVEWSSYYPHWYVSLSEEDPSQKIHDGLGFRNVLKTVVPQPYNMANLVPQDAWKWPPHSERNIAQKPSVTCPDSRTSMVVELTAFDISDKGFSVPFFRRQMAILIKLQSRGEIPVEKILSTFTRSQIEDIYPPLSPIMLQILVEELVLVGFIVIHEGQASLTPKGKEKLKHFQSNLPEKDREVFEQYQR